LGGLFEANTAYTAAITLTAASGYTLTGAAGSFTHTGAELTSYMAGTTTARVRFGATTSELAAAVSDVDLTNKVSVPVRGGTPVSYFSASQYTGNVSWSVSSGGQAVGGLFEAGTAYTATVTLTAVSGHTLSGASFTYSGALTVSNSAGSGGVVITFPAISGVAAITVSDRDLPYKLPAPMRGGRR
jgi:hypothetical protein